MEYEDSIMDGAFQRIAKDMVALQDAKVNELLAKHGLKGKTPEELQEAGYRLDHTSTGSQLGAGPVKHTLTLSKVVDTSDWSVSFSVGLES